MDSIYLDRRFPEAYAKGRKDRLRFENRKAAGMASHDMQINPYPIPVNPDTCSCREWHAYNAGWSDTKPYSSEAA